MIMPVYTANQPLFFPLIYMMERFARVDHLVIMEEAQFTKFGHQARVQLATRTGLVTTVLPLQDRAFKALDQVLVHDPARWAGKIKKQMQTIYGRQPGYKADMGGRFDVLIDNLVEEDGPLTAARVGSASIRWLCALAGLAFYINRSIELVPERPCDPTMWIAAFGTALRARAYLGGETAMRAYVDKSLFDARGIALVVQDYRVPAYRQLHTGSLFDQAFNPMVSALDPLFIGGPALLQELIGAQLGAGDTNRSMRPWEPVASPLEVPA